MLAKLSFDIKGEFHKGKRIYRVTTSKHPEYEFHDRLSILSYASCYTKSPVISRRSLGKWHRYWGYHLTSSSCIAIHNPTTSSFKTPSTSKKAHFAAKQSTSARFWVWKRKNLSAWPLFSKSSQKYSGQSLIIAVDVVASKNLKTPYLPGQ